MEKPQKAWSEHNFKLYNSGFLIAKFALGRKFEYEFNGLENILDEPGVFAMNHQKLEDSVFLAMAYTKATGRPMAVISQAEYARGLGIRGKDGQRRFGRLARFFVNNVGAISIDRDGGSLRETRDEVNKALDAGIAIGVHPDATRAENGKVNKFHPFFTRIAFEQGVPLYPVGGHYSETASRKSKHFDLTVAQPFTERDYNSLHLRMLPKNKRIEHINNDLERKVALAANLEQSGHFAEIPKITTLTEQ